MKRILIAILTITFGCNSSSRHQEKPSINQNKPDPCPPERNAAGKELKQVNINDTTEQLFLNDTLWFEVIGPSAYGENKHQAYIRNYRTNGLLEAEGIAIYFDHPIADYQEHGKWKYYGCDGQWLETKEYFEGKLVDARPCMDSEKYGLQSISKEADSLEIRICYSYAFLDRVPVVSIRQSKTGEWSGRLYVIEWSFDETRPKIKETKVKDLSPKTGWSNFYRSLEKLQVLTIPDMNPEDYGLDGSSYTFQIERNGTCSSYSYWMPDQLQNQDPNARKVVQILDKIASDLGVPWGIGNDAQRQAFWSMALDSTLRPNP